MRARKLLAVGLAALALGVVAVGCGSSDDNKSSSSGNGSSSSSSSGSGSPIKIAYLSDCEGAFGAFYEPDIAEMNAGGLADTETAAVHQREHAEIP